MRYAILVLRACFKIVYTHHFEGKKNAGSRAGKGRYVNPKPVPDTLNVEVTS